MGKTFLRAVFFLLILSASGCQKSGTAQSPIREEELIFGTLCQITYYDEDKAQAVEAGFQELKRLDALFSRQDMESELGRLNRDGRGALSPETLALLEMAFEYAYLTDDLFHPALGELVDLWGIGTEDARVPGREEIETLLPPADRKDIVIQEGEVVLPEGVTLDLGGIAKGYGADRVKQVLTDKGVESAIINLGGNVLLLGLKPDGSRWKIGLQNPHSERGAYIGIFSLDAQTMVTSGNYERFFEYNGVRYHHILDTRTGYPVENGLQSVTVITGNSTDADALSTSLYAMGLDKGMAFVRAREDLFAIFVTEDDKVYLSPGCEEYFTLTDSSFTLSSL